MKDTSPEIEKIQREMVRRMSAEQRIDIACAMFIAAREVIIASLPEDLSPREFKQQLYFRTYGEHLPDGFPFDD